MLTQKYDSWQRSSTVDRVGLPANLPMNRRKTGNKAIKTASITEGSNPVITPKITLGHLLMKLRNGTTLVKKLIFEIAPTTATGKDQNMIRTTTIPIESMFLIVRVFQEMSRFDQITSSGRAPITLGDMCRGI